MKRLTIRVLLLLAAVFCKLRVHGQLVSGEEGDANTAGVDSGVNGAQRGRREARVNPTQLSFEESLAELDDDQLRAIAKALDLVDDLILTTRRLTGSNGSTDLLLSVLEGNIPGILGGSLNLTSKDSASILTDLFGDRSTPGIPAWIRALTEGRNRSTTGDTNSSTDTEDRESLLDLVKRQDSQSARQTLLSSIFQNVPDGLQAFNLSSNSSAQDILNSLIDSEALTNSLSTGARDLLRLVVRDAELMLLSQQFPVEPGTQCASDLREFATGLMERQLWSLKMLDASGKIPPGLLTGYTTMEGNYVECVRLSHPATENHSINGKFCGLQLSLSIGGVLGFDEYITSQLNPLRLHVCLPASCTEDNIVGLMTPSVAAAIKSEIVDIDCYQRKDPSHDHWFWGAIVWITILAVQCGIGSAYGLYLDRKANKETKTGIPEGTLALKVNGHLNVDTHLEKNQQETETKTGVPGVHGNASDADKTAVNMNTGTTNNSDTTNITVIENLRNEEVSANNGHVVSEKALNTTVTSPPTPPRKETTLDRAVLSFSVLRNASKLLNCNLPPTDVPCLHGIRFLSLSWVIFGHAYSQGKETRGNTDYKGIVAESFTNQVMYSALFSVDTFFLLSGLLTSLLFLRSVRKSGVTPAGVLVYYIHRYLRLTPIYLLVIVYYTGIFPYTKLGPYMNLAGMHSETACRDVWWQNILYINNFAHGGLEHTCVRWSWYLTVDMQLSFIAPFILVPWALRGTSRRIGQIVGHSLSAALIVVHIASTAYICYVKEVSMIGNYMGYFEFVYIVPWCRMGVYAIGLLLGFVLYKTNGKVKMAKGTVLLGWLLAWVVGLAIAYANYGNVNDLYISGLKWTKVEDSVYESLNKVGWGMSVAWLIFACCNGYGGPINTILSWKAFVPLSRLTYGAYLTHLVVFHTIHGNYMKLHYLDSWTVLEQFLSLLVLSYMASFICSMLIEAPFIQLEKIVLGRIFRRRK